MRRIWSWFTQTFNGPTEIHRVLIVIPLAAMLSHIVYLYSNAPKGVPLTKDQIITISIGAVLYSGAWLYVFLSNKRDFKLYLRFFFCAALSALAHRLIVALDSFGTWYYTTVSLITIVFVMIFVVSGRTSAINDINIWFNVKLSKKNENNQIYAVSSNTNTDQHAGTG